MNSKFSTAWLATARTQVCILEIDEYMYRSIRASIQGGSLKRGICSVELLQLCQYLILAVDF